LSFAVYKPEKQTEKPETIKQTRTEQPKTKKQTRKNKRKNKKSNKLPKMKTLVFNGITCKISLEIKKPGKTEEKQLKEKIERLKNN
jgi:hypothetical protein